MEQIYGHTIEHWQGRFTKTFDIPAAAHAEVRLDKVVLWVVATRAGESQFKVLESGEVREKTVYEVSDAMPLAGDLRDQAINFLAHDGEPHGRFDLAPPAFSVDDEPSDDELPADPATGEVPMDAPRPDVEPEPEFVRDVMEHAVEVEGEAGTETIGRLDEYKDHTGPAPASGGGEGPKVAKFDPEAMGAGDVAEIPVGEREQLGSVYPDGHQGKDKILQRAKESIEL